MIDCWIEVEQDGVKSQIVDIGTGWPVKDELSAIEKPSGRLVWAWRESGDEELWAFGITVTDLNDTTQGHGEKGTCRHDRHDGASQILPSGSGRWSLEHGYEIELYSLHKKGEGEIGKRDWTATLKCKAVK